LTAPTITCLIVDDEPLARTRLRALAAGITWLAVLGEVATGRAAVAVVDELQPDLIFLDVQLPDLSGLDVLGLVRHRPAVIFTTAYDQFAVTAFEIGALDYLLKPFGRARFDQALARARPLVEAQTGTATESRAQAVMVAGPVTRLFVREAGRIVPVAAATVERIEACDDYVLVHAAGRTYRLNLQLNELEQRLDPRVFVRVHRSHMVNLDHVRSLEPYDGSRFQLTLKSGAILVASRQRSRLLRDLGR